MNSGNDQPMEGTAREHVFIVSGEEMNRIAVQLTVVHAYVQMLRRRITKASLEDTGELDEVLAHMEGATRTMTDDLWSIMNATTYPQRQDNAG